jgi:hypothetical protein
MLDTVIHVFFCFVLVFGHFSEYPNKFAGELHELFDIMCSLLSQKLLNTADDCKRQ